MEVTLLFKDRQGKQRCFSKSFKNESHFENFVDYMERLGYKYQGRYDN